MKAPYLGRRLTSRAYRIVRMFVRLFGVVLILLFCAFLYLRVHGVPEPLLQEMVRKANAAGIPVDIKHMRLTLRGWLASGVRYYSKHPDDLEPIFEAQEVYFNRKPSAAAGWGFDVEAHGIHMNPSIEWGVEIPEDSGCRHVETMQLTVGFLPDRIELLDGTMSWLGVEFFVSGTILKSTKPPVAEKPDAEPVRRRQETMLPVYVDAAGFRRLEDRFRALKLHDGGRVDITFWIDAADFASSHFDLDLHAGGVSYRSVGFTELDVSGRYEYPKLELKQAMLKRGHEAIRLEGKYDLGSGELGGKLRNSITATKPMLLLPRAVQDAIVKLELQFEALPEFDIDFGPAMPSNLLNHVSGTFSIKDVLFRKLEIENLRGKIVREAGRLDLTDLQGAVAGQEFRAGEVGSSMHGGSAEGSVFWDAGVPSFGVTAAGSFDPNLLLDPLSMVWTATNAISRFRFEKDPPTISLKLGSRLDDWSTFFIDIEGTGREMLFHDVAFSSVNAAVFYSNGVLRIKQVAGTQGADYVKGSASIDFFGDTFSFDGVSTMQAAALEDTVFSGFNLFGNKIKTSGRTSVKAHGTVDWADMDSTDFTAEVEADRMEIPIAAMDGFKALVKGTGPRISVEDAVFGMYGGEGEGAFSIILDPATTNLPYETELSFRDVDFRNCLLFLHPERDPNVGGKVHGNVDLAADLAGGFFELANGTGSVSIVEGQLADLPFFTGFSKLIRMVIPSFHVFSITSLKGSFQLKDGVVYSRDAYFGGDVISATGKGSYSKQNGFDAVVKAEMTGGKRIGKVVQAITNPLFELLELELGGTLSDPAWRLEKLPKPKRPQTVKDGKKSD